jgi:hypothetical protein
MEFVHFVALTTKRLTLNKFKSRRLHEKHTVATWNMGTVSALA